MSLVLATLIIMAPPPGATASVEPAAVPRSTHKTRRGNSVAPPRWEPWFALSSKGLFQTLELEQGGQVQRDRDWLWKPAGLWVGAQGYYRKRNNWATGGWRGDLSLGVELWALEGSPSLGLQHTSGYEWRSRRRRSLNLFLGGRLAAVVDPVHRDQRHLEIGPVLGLSWRRAELQWAPSLSAPLDADQRDVFDGQVRRRVALHVMPLNVVVALKAGRHRPTGR